MPAIENGAGAAQPLRRPERAACFARLDMHAEFCQICISRQTTRYTFFLALELNIAPRAFVAPLPKCDERRRTSALKSEKKPKRAAKRAHSIQPGSTWRWEFVLETCSRHCRREGDVPQSTHASLRPQPKRTCCSHGSSWGSAAAGAVSAASSFFIFAFLGVAFSFSNASEGSTFRWIISISGFFPHDL